MNTPIDSQAISELILMSVGTEKGSWFADLSFGSELHTIDKVDNHTAAKLRSMIVQATRWIVDDGLAKELQVETERSGKNAIHWSIKALRPDGNSEFVERLWHFDTP